MRAGLMRRIVTIRTAGVAVSDGMGGTTPGTPVDVTGIPARVEPLLGSEMLRAQQTGMVQPHRITIRYRNDMTTAKTVLYDGFVFDVKSVVDPESMHRELQLLAEKMV